MPSGAAPGCRCRGRCCGAVACLGIIAVCRRSLRLRGRRVRGIGGMNMGTSLRVRVRGPLAEFRVGFDAELASVGYTDLSRAQQLRLLARLSDWLVAEGVDPDGLDDAAIEEFLEARRSAGYIQWRSLAGLA